MRKYLALAVVAAFATGTAAMAFAAAPTNDQSKVVAKFSPRKLPKKKFKSGKLFVDTSTVNPNDPGTPTNPASKPSPTRHVQLDFDDDGKFNPKAAAVCKVNDSQLALEGSNSAATSACGRKSLIGSEHTRQVKRLLPYL